MQNKIININTIPIRTAFKENHEILLYQPISEIAIVLDQKSYDIFKIIKQTKDITFNELKKYQNDDELLSEFILFLEENNFIRMYNNNEKN